MTKITQLDALTTQAAGDLIVIVDDVGGSPETKKISITNLFQGIPVDVGIGVTPQYLLHLDKDVDDFLSKMHNDGNAAAAGGLWLDTRWNVAGNYPLRVTTNSGGVEVLACEGSGRVGIGILASIAGKAHIDQSSTTGAIPVLVLDQADIDIEFLKFIGSSEDGEADRSLVDVADMTTPGALVGWFQIYVEDIQGTNPITDGVYYVPFYAAPSA